MRILVLGIIFRCFDLLVLKLQEDRFLASIESYQADLVVCTHIYVSMRMTANLKYMLTCKSISKSNSIT